MIGLSKSTINRIIQKMEELSIISYDGSVRKKVIVIQVYNLFVEIRNYQY